MGRRARRLAGAVAVAAVLVPCAWAGTSPLAGAYATKLKHVSSSLNGRWDVEIAADGRDVVYRESKLAVRGRSHVDRDRVRLTDERGPAACPGASSSGSYTWRLATTYGLKLLVLTAVGDSCAARKRVLASYPLVRIT